MSVRRSAATKLHWNAAIAVEKRNRKVRLKSSLNAIKSATQPTSAEYEILESKGRIWRPANTHSTALYRVYSADGSWKASRERSISDGPMLNSTDEDSTSLIVAIRRLSSPPVAGVSLDAGDLISP